MRAWESLSGWSGRASPSGSSGRGSRSRHADGSGCPAIGPGYPVPPHLRCTHAMGTPGEFSERARESHLVRVGDPSRLLRATLRLIGRRSSCAGGWVRKLNGRSICPISSCDRAGGERRVSVWVGQKCQKGVRVLARPARPTCCNSCSAYCSATSAYSPRPLAPIFAIHASHWLRC